MAAQPPSPSGQIQPKTVQKLLLRTAGLLALIALLVFGFNWYRGAQKDLGALRKSDTVGNIAAVEMLDDGGTQAVIIKPDGTVLRNDGYVSGSTERDLAWSPDGNFLFFVSDRKEGVFHILRWAPGPNSVEPRTIGKRGRSNPTFAVGDTPDKSDSALMTSGGYVVEFSPRDSSTQVVLPPTTNEITITDAESGAGAQSAFQGAYSKLGESFRMARWFMGRSWVAGIMKRDEGEVLIVQNLTRDAQGKLPPPLPLAAGNRIDIDVNPKTGGLVYSVQGFQWPLADQIPPEFRKGNRVTRPYTNGVFLFTPEEKKELSTEDLKNAATGSTPEGNGPVVISENDKGVFDHPRISPDGSTLLLVAGSIDEGGTFLPGVLLSMPVQTGAVRAATPILRGQIYEPSWGPDSRMIAFARRDPAGKRTLYTINRDGSGERNLTGGKGNFRTPLISPQVRE